LTVTHTLENYARQLFFRQSKFFPSTQSFNISNEITRIAIKSNIINLSLRTRADCYHFPDIKKMVGYVESVCAFVLP